MRGASIVSSLHERYVTSVEGDLSLYGDDSALIYSHRDPYFIARYLNAQLTWQTWLINNRLSLHGHVGKTESILFGSSLVLVWI